MPGDAVLAWTEEPGPRVGRYGVDVEAFERLVLPLLVGPPDPGKLHILDEVGKMECLSGRFRAAVERIFAAGIPVIATVPLRASGFPARIRSWPGARTFHLAPANRDEVRTEVLRLARAMTGE